MTYNSSNRMTPGGDVWEIAGDVNILAASGGNMQVDGVDLTPKAGTVTADGDDDTAGTLDIVTGLSTIAALFVQIRRAGVNVAEDAVVTYSGGTVTVADGAGTYAITDGDVIHYLALGAA